ncbi:MAG TPA: hypothetical protein VMK31_09280 [Sphingomicrobium sp.]|nr:hypothetical protein [Sphingomicrobium sp.]
MITSLKFLKSRFLRRSLLLPELDVAALAREIFYQGLLDNAARGLSVALPPLYPVKGAANWSLLYGLFRLATESGVKSVLELGAGQSTILLNALADQRLKVTTVETDPDWAAFVRQRVKTEVVLMQMTDREVHGRNISAYEGLDSLRDVYDCIVVDAPVGTKRYSRWASLEILDRCLGDEFVAVFDDAERRGEQDTIKAFLQTSKGRRAQLNFVRGAKHQCYLYTQRYAAVAYF